jgi:hypothetical protein
VEREREVVTVHRGGPPIAIDRVAQRSLAEEDTPGDPQEHVNVAISLQSVRDPMTE